jgi:hypothetical protein
MSIDRQRIRVALEKLDALIIAHPELREGPSRARLGQWLEDEQRMAQAKRPGVFIRMDTDLLERIDAYVDRMARDQPGTLPTRSDAIRVLIYKGLDATSQRPTSPDEDAPRGKFPP